MPIEDAVITPYVSPYKPSTDKVTHSIITCNTQLVLPMELYQANPEIVVERVKQQLTASIMAQLDTLGLDINTEVEHSTKLIRVDASVKMIGREAG